MSILTCYCSGETIQLHLTHAVASALRTPAGYHFLVLGVDEAGAKHLALVTTLTSVLRAPVESTIPFEASSRSEATQLLLLAAELSAMNILDSLLQGQKLVVHNASDVVAQAFTSQASTKQVVLTFTADSDELCTPSVAHRLILPSYLERSEVAQLLPQDVACFVGCSATDQDSETENTVLSVLPPYCRRESNHTMYSTRGVETGSPGSLLAQTLRRAEAAVGNHASQDLDSSSPARLISIDALANGERPGSPLAIIDWTSSSPSLSARVSRFESKQLFKSDKTYWLVGLSGALGISLFDWMIERGVRHLVITSRNPKIDQRWVDDHTRAGVNIHILPWYVLLDLFVNDGG